MNSIHYKQATLNLRYFFETVKEVLYQEFNPWTVYSWIRGRRSPVPKITAKLLLVLYDNGLLDAFMEVLKQELEEDDT